MKIINGTDVTGRGERGFVYVIPETPEDGMILQRDFEGDELGNGNIYFHHEFGLCGYFDPEYVAVWLNKHLFCGCLSTKNLEELEKCLFRIGGKDVV